MYSVVFLKYIFAVRFIPCLTEISALVATFGDVNAAVERLLAARQPGSLS